MCLNRSNVNLDRKILADLAINEPYSFKAVSDEIARQNEFNELDLESASQMKRAQYGTTLAEALALGKMRKGPPPTEEEQEQIMKDLIPKPYMNWGLRYPEKDAKTEL